jgi:hypothetical protein
VSLKSCSQEHVRIVWTLLHVGNTLIFVLTCARDPRYLDEDAPCFQVTQAPEVAKFKLGTDLSGNKILKDVASKPPTPWIWLKDPPTRQSLVAAAGE